MSVPSDPSSTSAFEFYGFGNGVDYKVIIFPLNYTKIASRNKRTACDEKHCRDASELVS